MTNAAAISALSFSPADRARLAAIRQRHFGPVWIYARPACRLEGLEGHGWRHWYFHVCPFAAGSDEFGQAQAMLLAAGYRAVVGTGEPLTRA